MIEIKNLTKTFPSADGTFYALKNVSLTINDGEIYGIIGMSGAGKSTLVRCINMLERPTEGAVLVNGCDVGTLRESELRKTRREVTMIFQGFHLLMQRTVLRNIVSRFPAGEVCFDVCGPMMVNTGLKPDSLRRNAAQIRSGLADGHKVERWEPRLQLIEQRSYMEFARRRWGLTGIFFRAFPHLARKFSSLLAYRISATE